MKIIAKLSKNSVIIYLLAVVCAFSSAIIFSSRSYATDVSLNASFVNSGSDRYFSVSVDDSNNANCVSWCHIVQNTSSSNGLSVRNFQAYLPNGTYYTDNVWELVFNVWKVNSSQSLHSVFNSIQVDNSVSGPWKLMGVEYEQYDTNTTTVHIWVKQIYQYTVNNYGPRFVSSEPGSTFVIYLEPTERISFNYWSLWAINDPNAGDSAIISAIESQPDYTNSLNTINNGIGSVNNNLNQVNNNLNQVQDSIDQSNQDANDRYEDEKDTINDNGDNAQNLWNGATFTLNFTDPFTTLWNLFTDAQCVDITTLATLLNVPSHSTICSPWSPSLRSIFTPCFNLFAIFFALGFFIRWLSDGTGVNVDYYDTYVHQGHPYFKKRGD